VVCTVLRGTDNLAAKRRRRGGECVVDEFVEAAVEGAGSSVAGRNRVWKGLLAFRGTSAGPPRAAIHMLITIEVDGSGVSGSANPAGVYLERVDNPAGPPFDPSS
jgi:hypothetical protein